MQTAKDPREGREATAHPINHSLASEGESQHCFFSRTPSLAPGQTPAPGFGPLRSGGLVPVTAAVSPSGQINYLPCGGPVVAAVAEVVAVSAVVTASVVDAVVATVAVAAVGLRQ